MITRALLYLRKSTDEHQADSIDTQRFGATRFVGEHLKGDVVDEIVDEGESRAEFKRRPGFSRLLALCASKDRDFDVVVVRDESRLGAGERLTVALDDMLAAGVRIFYYASGEEVRLDSMELKLVHSVRAIVADAERAKTAGRTREAHDRKARLGLNVGGRCYGYDNLRVTGSDGKSRTEYQINPEQAKVVLEIARRYGSGESERSIAHDLNTRAVPSPQAGRRGTYSWSPNCIREMIRRPRYRGILEWGHIGAEYRGGTRVTFSRKRAEVVTVERPELRIIPVDLDEAIQARIVDLQQRRGMADVGGRPPRYLLSGKVISRCGVCGGPMHVSNRRQGKVNIKVYSCLWRRDRGESICTNSLRRPVEVVDGVLVRWIQKNVLSEGVMLAVLARVRERLAEHAKTSTGETATMEAELARLDREIKRLVAVAASLDEADQPEELAKQIEEKSRRRRALRVRLDAMQTAPDVLNGEVDRLAGEVRLRLAGLQAMLTRQPAEARRMIETLFQGPITFTPAMIDGAPRFALSGVATASVFQNFSDPSGT